MVHATSPQTPLQDTIKKVNSTPGPWSKALLEKAGKINASDEEMVISEEDLRRSKRKAIQRKGFRTSACKDADCIGCTIKPPTMPASVVKNLGTTFCKIDAERLMNEALTSKKQAAPPGGKKLLKKKSSKPSDEDEGAKNIKKKPKKH
ncbi:unnamed protein product [Urochloa humidicola]